MTDEADRLHNLELTVKTLVGGGVNALNVAFTQLFARMDPNITDPTLEVLSIPVVDGLMPIEGTIVHTQAAMDRLMENLFHACLAFR